ncbi:MAG: hypothetical protein VW405_01325 [Rhodospirillaceae bacterium]
MHEPRLADHLPSDPEKAMLVMAHVGFCKLLVEILGGKGLLSRNEAEALLMTHASEIRADGAALAMDKAATQIATGGAVATTLTPRVVERGR